MGFCSSIGSSSVYHSSPGCPFTSLKVRWGNSGQVPADDRGSVRCPSTVAIAIYEQPSIVIPRLDVGKCICFPELCFTTCNLTGCIQKLDDHVAVCRIDGEF